MLSIEQTIDPNICTDMTEVREGVDAVDRALVALLTKRFAYMDAAARIKTDRQLVRDEARKAQVLGNVAHSAKSAGLPVDPLVNLWDSLIEMSIAYELDRWDERTR